MSRKPLLRTRQRRRRRCWGRRPLRRGRDGAARRPVGGLSLTARPRPCGGWADFRAQAAQRPMLPEIKDFSSLLMANGLAGSVARSRVRKASSGVATGLNIATMAKRRRPMGVDGGRLRLRVARDGGRGRRPVRRVGLGLRNARRALPLLAGGRSGGRFAAERVRLTLAPRRKLRSRS